MVHALRKPWASALILSALAFATFAAAIRYDFVNYDDDVYVYRNPGVLGGLSPAGIKYALTSSEAGTWAPVTWLSYQIDTTVQGPRARSYHLTNIFLHALAGAILLLALRTMHQSPWTSLVVAGIFLLHPLRSESVAWVAERKDVLCAFFCSGAIQAAPTLASAWNNRGNAYAASGELTNALADLQ